MPGDVALLLNEFGDFPMMRKMLVTLKQRAEGRAAGDARAAARARSPVR